MRRIGSWNVRQWEGAIKAEEEIIVKCSGGGKVHMEKVQSVPQLVVADRRK